MFDNHINMVRLFFLNKKTSQSPSLQKVEYDVLNGFLFENRELINDKMNQMIRPV